MAGGLSLSRGFTVLQGAQQYIRGALVWARALSVAGIELCADVQQGRQSESGMRRNYSPKVAEGGPRRLDMNLVRRGFTFVTFLAMPVFLSAQCPNGTKNCPPSRPASAPAPAPRPAPEPAPRPAPQPAPRPVPEPAPGPNNTPSQPNRP